MTRDVPEHKDVSPEDQEATDAARRRLSRAGERAMQGDVGNDAEGERYALSRQVFAGLYSDLQREGYAPDESGIIHPTGHPGVEITPHGDVYGSYQELTDYLSSEELTTRRGAELTGLEAHHLLEDRTMEPFGFSKGEGPCVAVYAHEHAELVHGENGVDHQLPRGYRYDIWDVVEGHTQAYEDIGRPEWADKVRGYVRANRERIITAYEDGTVSWATEKDVQKVKKYMRTR